MDTKVKTSLKSYLSFKIDQEIYAVNVRHVLNILELVNITKVPHAPDYMKGVINLRGKVLPVIDTRIRFGLQEIEYSSNTCILVMELSLDDQEIQAGFLVDNVQEVLEIEEDEILPPPNLGNSFRSDFISGVGKQDEEFIMILDIEKVLSQSEIKTIKKISQTN